MDNIGSIVTLPVVALTAVALVVVLLEALIRRSEPVSYWTSLIGLTGGILLVLTGGVSGGGAAASMIGRGPFPDFFSCLFMFSALLTVVLSREALRRTHREFGEFYLLVLFATVGMMMIASAVDLIMLFLGIELMSLCLYVLAGFFRNEIRSNEASLKYFLLGAFATGFLVYGMALLYGAAGTTDLPRIIDQFPALEGSAIFWAGMSLLLVGLAFKAAAVPFHMWVPDVYEGSPTSVSGFMSTGGKAAAFAALMIVFGHSYAGGERLRTVFALIAASSMVLGNVVAISQSNIKRMLAYSSIAHAGYILTGLAAGNGAGRIGVLYYVMSYAFMNLGAFGIAGLLEREGGGGLSIEDYGGLSGRKPLLAALMAVFMFSLAGVPPFAGFFGKYYVFAGAIAGGYTWLAILGVLTSLMGMYYYLRVVVVMYFREGGNRQKDSHSAMALIGLSVAALAVIWLGVFPAPLLAVINDALR